MGLSHRANGKSKGRRTSGKKVRLLMVQRNRKDLETITKLCESGKVRLNIDRQYPLSEVPEALRYFGEERTKGKIVITVASDNKT